MPILGVSVAAGGVRLPDFDHSVRNRSAIFVEHAAGHDDSFAESLTAVEMCEIVFTRERAYRPQIEDR